MRVIALQCEVPRRRIRRHLSQKPTKNSTHLDTFRVLEKSRLATVVPHHHLEATATCYSEVVELRFGDVLARAGMPPTGIYVILSGECVALDDFSGFGGPPRRELRPREGGAAATRARDLVTELDAELIDPKPQDANFPVATLRVGDCINALAVAARTPCLDTVIASTPKCRAIRISEAHFVGWFLLRGNVDALLAIIEDDAAALRRRFARVQISRRFRRDPRTQVVLPPRPRTKRLLSARVVSSSMSSAGRAVTARPGSPTSWFGVDFRVVDGIPGHSGCEGQFVVEDTSPRCRIYDYDPRQTMAVLDGRRTEMLRPVSAGRGPRTVVYAPLEKVCRWTTQAASKRRDFEQQMVRRKDGAPSSPTSVGEKKKQPPASRRRPATAQPGARKSSLGALRPATARPRLQSSQKPPDLTGVLGIISPE